MSLWSDAFSGAYLTRWSKYNIQMYSCQVILFVLMQYLYLVEAPQLAGQAPSSLRKMKTKNGGYVGN